MRLLTYHKPAGLLTCQCWNTRRHSERTPARYPSDPSSRGMRETNDCTVWAISTACRVTYWRTLKELYRRGRKPRQGWRTTELGPEGMFLGVAYRKVFDWFDRAKDHNRKYGGRYSRGRVRLRTFVQQHPRGRYVVVVHGHALAVIDGVLVDCAASGGDKRLVKHAWKIVENNACTNQSSVR